MWQSTADLVLRGIGFYVKTPTAERASTAKKGRPTPKRNGKKALSANAPASAPASTPDRRPLKMVVCAAVAFVHTVATLMVLAYSGGDPIYVTAMMLFLAVTTFVFVPESRKYGYHRWLAVVGLSLIVQADGLPMMLVVAHTWILYLFWVVEGTPQVPAVLRRIREDVSN